MAHDSSPVMRFSLHFAPLFLVAFTAWAAFDFLREGTVHLVPGVIAAAVLGALGTYIALTLDERRDLRGRDALEGYETRRMERTMARTGSALDFRTSRSR